MAHPAIRFKNGWLLEPKLTAHYRLTIGDPSWEPLANDERSKIISEYEVAWRKDEAKILTGIQNILGLQFAEQDITVYVASASHGATSNPLIIGTRYSPDLAVDEITHELFHRLLSMNIQEVDIASTQEKMFPGEQKLVQNHILLHAAHEKLYLEVLKAPQRLARDMKQREEQPAYKRAWSIVEEQGADTILGAFAAERYK